MPNFAIDTAAARFEKDFQLIPVAGYAPSAGEKAYIEQLNKVLKALENDAADDDHDPEKAGSPYILARKEKRKSAAEELQHEANEFVAGRLDPSIAADNTLVQRFQNSNHMRPSKEPHVVV